MEAEIVKGNIGTVGKYDVEFKDGKLVMMIEEKDPVGETTLVRSISAKVVLDALKKAIPGTIDDVVINAIESALGL